MRHCKQIVDLVSQGMESKLPWSIRMEVKMHLLMCKNCYRYAKQLKFMQSELKTIENNIADTALTETAKKRIQQSLKLAIHETSND
ncbi:MAG: zf-HC2 domain-containing protein [Methyloprofundus sp.]|nr:zf-HC2 domain-containing protein [Methyloprofundus sp.]